MNRRVQLLLIISQFCFCCLVHATQTVEPVKTQDVNQAIVQIEQFAEKGDAKSQADIGIIYVSGKLVPQNYALGIKWLEKASAQNEASAQNALGILYFDGRGVQKNLKQALTWFLKAAEQGNVNSQLMLGLFYYQGLGIPKDYLQAHKWLNLAATAGDGDAKKVLSKLETEMTSTQLGQAKKVTTESKPSNEKKYSEYIQKVTAEINNFKDQLVKGSICPSYDLKCFENEISKVELKTVTQAVLYNAIVADFIIKSKQAKISCDKNCSKELILKMFDLQTKLLTKFDLKKLYTYSDFLKGDSESIGLQAMEEFTFYQLFQKTSKKLSTTLAKIDQESLTPEFKNIYAGVTNRLHDLTEEDWLLNGSLAVLESVRKSDAFFKSTLSDPFTVEENQNIEQYKKDIQKAKIKRQAKK